MVQYSKQYLIITTLIYLTLSVELPLKYGQQTCASLLSAFDPIKVQINFPQFTDKQEDYNFIVDVIEYENSVIFQSTVIGGKTQFRHSYQLQTNKLYQICIKFQGYTSREETIYINFTQIQDFQRLIGRVQIPPELLKDEKLQKLYAASKKLKYVTEIVKQHQQKQRKLEDQIVTKNIHKSNRILTLGFIEVLVIILSGVYQILSLRKFLIQKNLY